MKVATRITVATAVVVAIAAASYAMFDVRARVTERRMTVEREAAAVVKTIRVQLEASANEDIRDARYRAEQLAREVEQIDKRLGVTDESGEPPEDGADPIVPPTPAEQATLRKQREELVPLLAAARVAGGLAKPLDLGLSYRPPNADRLREISRATNGWKVVVLPRVLAGEVPALTAAFATTDATPAQLRRLKTMADVLSRGSPILDYPFSDVENDTFYYAVPLRSAAERDQDRVVLAMLEITKPASAFDATPGDYSRALVLVILIVVVTTVMVGALALRFVSRPITKLLRGIDDVAKGDLSHVILSERDDEIGAIATRFNEMTYSLRESRTETQQENEAKLALEQRLGQTEKLATIGQLAAEIAHEVGTPLNVIAGRARSIQKKSKDPEAVEKNAEIVAEQTARITRIIQRLLDFTRRKVGATERAAVNLNDLTTSTLELLAGQFSVARVRTRLDKAADLPRVAGDADRLQQVLINLLLNAVQAMPDGGALSIETHVVERTRPGLETAADQRFVRCSIADTGVGIPADIKDKIFDPFYTTKDATGGTGLGLAVCSGIVKEHDGWIEVDDAPGGGTVFRVFLPA